MAKLEDIKHWKVEKGDTLIVKAGTYWHEEENMTILANLHNCNVVAVDNMDDVKLVKEDKPST